MTYTLQDFKQIAKYGISGVMGGLIQLGFLYLFVDIFGVWYLYGVISAYLVALVVVFALQKFWTFNDYSMESFHRQTFMYTIIAAGSLALNIITMYIFVDIFHIWHMLAQVIVVGVVGALSFLLNKMFTFTHKTQIK